MMTYFEIPWYKVRTRLIFQKKTITSAINEYKITLAQIVAFSPCVYQNRDREKFVCTLATYL